MKRPNLLLLSMFFTWFIALNVNAQCASIYVSPTGTSFGDGTESNPVDLLTGLAQACTQSRPHVRLLAGTYTVTSKLTIDCDNIILDGGWEIVSGTGRKNSSLVTTINIDSPLETAPYDGVSGTFVGYYIGIEAISKTGFRIQDIAFNVKNGGLSGIATSTTGNRGNSVYGFYFRNSSSWNLERCEMNTGAGSTGANGINGSNGASGVAGGTGSTGDEDDDCMTNYGGAGGTGGGGTNGAAFNNDNSCYNTGITGGGGSAASSYRNGGGGGAGGSAGTENNSGGAGGSGGIGGNGATAGTLNGAGGSGTSSSSGNCSNQDGRAGSSGSNGNNGMNGTIIAVSTTYDLFWLPSGKSNDGTNGAGGGGGHGGGGGGGQGGTWVVDGTGSGGGGGGGGGQGGAFGTGGYGGGGSFALYLYGGNGTQNNVLLNNGAVASGGIGGIGGNGGNGGAGGFGGDGNNTSLTGGCALSGSRTTNGEVGAGGQGGAGGAGGTGGTGGNGAAGVSVASQMVNGASSTVTTSALAANVITNKPLEGCTNSEIIITKSAGTWSLTSGSYIQDQNATTSSYSNTSATAIISFSTPGSKSIVIDGVTYDGFIQINTSRPLPAFDASMSSTVCEGNAFQLYTPTVGTEYEWVIFPASGTVSVPLAIYTTQVASWQTPVTGVNANYSVRLRVKQDCCGWSVPVYFNFLVVSGSTGPVASGLSICENNAATLAASGSGLGDLVWYADPLGQLVLQTTSGSTATFTTPVLAQSTIYYIGETIGSCLSGLTAVQVTVDSLPASPQAISQQVCEGSSAMLTASGSGGTISWYSAVTGGTALATGTSYTTAALTSGTYTYYLEEDNGTCISPRSSVVVTAASLPGAPTAVKSPDVANVCEGTVLTLTQVSDIGGGTGTCTIEYAVNGGTWTTTLPVITAVAGTTTIEMRKSCSGNGCGSSAISSYSWMVNPLVASPAIVISTPLTTVCDGTAVTFTSTSTNAGTSPVYEWFVNGISQSVNAAVFNTSSLNDNDVITAEITSSEVCVLLATSTSNSLVISEHQTVTPTIQLAADNTSICEGTTVIFTANAAYEGNNPVYQWSVNGITAGANSTVFSSSSLVNGDQVSVTLTSDAACATTTTVSSVPVSITVNPVVVPFVFISAPATTICPGTAVTIQSTVTDAGSNPVYDWRLNGLSTGQTGTVYTTNSLATGDNIALIIFADNACASVSTAISNNLTFTVEKPEIASVVISTLSGKLCENEEITFIGTTNNAAAINGYQWYVNNQPTGTNSIVFPSNPLSAGDNVQLELYYDNSCGVSDSVLSNVLSISQQPVVDAGPAIEIYVGSSVQLQGQSSVPGSYSWSPAESLDDAAILNPLATPGTTTAYTLVVSTDNGCIGSDQVLVTVNSQQVEMVNSFTPNGDGINDVWNIPNIGLYPQMELKIYNRWGNLLYEQSNEYTPWDGTFKGDKLPSETYYYVLKLDDSSDAIKGPVTIVR